MPSIDLDLAAKLAPRGEVVVQGRIVARPVLNPTLMNSDTTI